MENERIEMCLPDGTKLIAESEKNSDYPSMNIFFIDAENRFETVAFAEYNSGKPIGRRLCVGVYRNNDDETKFYDSFCHCIRPTFAELEELYNERPNEVYNYVHSDGYMKLIATSDAVEVYVEFYCDGDNKHEGHKIKLVKHEVGDYIVSYAFECTDCNEVIYCVDNPKIKS